ncbi:hypothetical protein [Vulgatibacter sp.]|uniref:hypothetical protein n=1 Tax=Vulgatibacter sp. TaxID=1971226 RepID=UPI003562D646
MKRIAAALLAVSSLGGCAAAQVPAPDAFEQPVLTVRADGFANLIYQLDCLALPEVHCSREALRALWANGWSEADEGILQRWAAVVRSAAIDAPAEDEGGLHPLPHATPDAAEQLRVAGSLASDAAAWKRRAAALLEPAQVEAGLGVLAHFHPRFAAWWQAHGAAAARDAAAALETALDDPALARWVDELRRFYGAGAAEGFTLHLAVIPAEAQGPSYATQLGDHALLEMRPGDRPASRLEVAIHELCHRFLAHAPPAARREALASFVSVGDQRAMAAWALLDEAVATAAGNGLGAALLYDEATRERRLAAPLYGDPAIDGAARAILTLVREQIAAGGTVHDGAFLERYRAAVEAALGAQLDTPALQLRQVALVRDPALRPHALRLFGLLRASNGWEATLDEAPALLGRWRQLPAVVLFDPAEGDAMERVRALVDDPTLTLAPRTITLRHTAGGRPIHLLATAPDGAAALVDRFVACAAATAPCAPPR